jgi:hypothetical protein
VPALERLAGLRVVADPAALDAARWSTQDGDPVRVLRIAPDEAIAIGAQAVELADEHAVVVEEHGLVGVRCGLAELERHMDWPLPRARLAFAQGAVAGVPAKLHLLDDDTVDLVVAAAYAHELADRLGWLP